MDGECTREDFTIRVARNCDVLGFSYMLKMNSFVRILNKDPRGN